MYALVTALVALLGFSFCAEAKTKNPKLASNMSSASSRSDARITESVSLSTTPNRAAFSIEAFGRGLLYSVSLDYLLTSRLGVGAYATSSGFFGLGAYANYYLLTERHRPFVTAGAGYIVTSRDKQQGSQMRMDSGAIFSPGAGYEFRSDESFLLRVTGYALVEKSRGLVPWGGLSFGWTF